jgi:hypothetical protein
MKAEDVKKILIDNIKKVKEMSVEEYTLYRKWLEINEDVWSQRQMARIWEIKNTIWVPDDPMDYLKLEPVVVHADSLDRQLTWNILRIFTSTLQWSQNLGRSAKFYIIDNVTKRHLGVISLGSDFIAIGGRDKYIGWTLDQRLKDNMLNYTAMGNSIVPTQPLGFNYTGGKLTALMILSDTVERVWNDKYPVEKLAAVTTTSVYGGLSQYNRLKYWRKCDSSEGKIPIEPSNEAYLIVKDWVRDNYPVEYKKMISKREDGTLPTRPKTKVLQFAYTTLKVKTEENEAPRGVYFGELYKNTKEFLRMEDIVLGEKAFDNSCKALSDLWKERYAGPRIKNVLESKRFNRDKLFYDDIIGVSFEEVKSKYLDSVGR